MGGKDAIIVTDDADLDSAASGVVASAFGFRGRNVRLAPVLSSMKKSTTR